MKNKKGFTLIELLAVLLVLAILTLITIPITIKIVKNAKENSYKRSIENYGRAVENAVGRYLLTEPTADYSSITLATINSLIDYSEQAVTCDKLTVNSNGSIKLEGCFVFGSVNSEQTFIYENGLISKTKYIVYDVGSEIIVNNEHYYVISDKGFDDNYLVAIKENPLTVEEVNIYGKSGTEDNHVNRFTENSIGEAFEIKYLNSNNELVSTGIGGLAYYSSEECGYVNGKYKYNCKSSYDDSDIKYVVDNWADDKFKNNELEMIKGYKARIISYNEYYDAKKSRSDVNDDWLGGPHTQHWIYDPDNNEYNGWYIAWQQFHSYPAGRTKFIIDVCLRPVINVKKSAIESSD